MSATCAYCSTEAQLTKEHIIPSFVYTANPTSNFGYNLKAGRFIHSETQIKDVCAKCNNDLLSKVDNYASRFWIQNHVDRLITTEKSIPIVYDWRWLSRFLLKVTFNCLRFKGTDTECMKPFLDHAASIGVTVPCMAHDVDWLKPYKDFILHGVNRPRKLHLKLGIEILPCHKIKDSERHLLAENLKNCTYLPPLTFRVGSTIGFPADRMLFRFVAMNNFFFHFIFFKPSLPVEEFRSAMSLFASVCPDVTFLSPHTKKVNVNVSSRSALESYKDAALALRGKWAEHQSTDECI